jgi:predicted CXXCH cytochrome family protein
MKLCCMLKLLAPLALVWSMLAPNALGAAPPITVPFDHLTTGFELDGVHRDLPCESCHLNAVFRGTPRDCGTCHIKGSLFNATPKNTTHIPSTNRCAACHNTISFRPDVHFDHAEVMGSCVSCHNGTIAQGEGPTHPATSQDCAACHTVLSWNPPKTVDHTQIPLSVAGFCIICHNGKNASGKPAGHLATNLECGDCHLTTTWMGATFDHTGITTGCVSCHNGTKAVGKQGNHMPTTNLCESCHTTGIGTATPSWAPSKFDHTQMTVTTCQTCHSGSVKITTGFVSGQPTNHVPPIPSTVDCSVCHGNNPAAETWTVLAVSIATLHTGLNPANCLVCHAGETFAGVPAPYIPMSMSGVSPTKATPLAPPHIPVLAGTDCSACHGKAYQAGGFGPATPMTATTHKAVSSSCNSCHETGKSFYVGGGTTLQLRPADVTKPRTGSALRYPPGTCRTRPTRAVSNATPRHQTTTRRQPWRPPPRCTRVSRAVAGRATATRRRR